MSPFFIYENIITSKNRDSAHFSLPLFFIMILENYTKILSHSEFYDSALWLLFVISYIFDKCLKDKYLHDDYIIHSSFNDFRKTISYGLHMAMDCKIQLNSITAEKFYLSVSDYLNCILEKLGY